MAGNYYNRARNYASSGYARAKSGYARARNYASSGYARARNYAGAGYARAKSAMTDGFRYGDKDMNIRVRPEHVAGIAVGMTDADNAINPYWITLGAVAPVGGRIFGKIKGFCQGVILGNIIQVVRNQGAGVLAPKGATTSSAATENTVFMS